MLLKTKLGRKKVVVMMVGLNERERAIEVVWKIRVALLGTRVVSFFYYKGDMK